MIQWVYAPGSKDEKVWTILCDAHGAQGGARVSVGYWPDEFSLRSWAVKAGWQFDLYGGTVCADCCE